MTGSPTPRDGRQTVECLRVVRRLRAASAVKHVADADLDFELEPDGVVGLDAGTGGTRVSLYALDLAHGGVTFVETPAEHDLLASPFLHQAQREQAIRVLRVPFEALHALAATVTEGSAPPLLIHSVGRCGSTLISEMLHAVPGVASVSEPDVFTSIETAVTDGTLSEDEAIAVLRSACRLATYGLAAPGTRAALKFRSEVVWIAHLLDRAVPDSSVLFMYRDARRVIESYLRVLGRDRGWSDRLAQMPGLDAVMAARHARRVAGRGPRMQRFDYVLRGATPLDVEQRGRWGKFLIQWLAKVHHYTELRAVRDGVAALRYEDLVTDPESVLRAVFEHCDLPLDALPAALRAMGRDAQEGTSFERGAGSTWTMSPRDEREMARTFRECTPLDGPDAVLPGTLGRT